MKNEMSKKLQEIKDAPRYADVDEQISELDQLIEEAEEQLAEVEDQENTFMESSKEVILTEDQMVEAIKNLLGYVGAAEESNHIIRDTIRNFIRKWNK